MPTSAQSRELFFLAMDHRREFLRSLGLGDGRPGPEQLRTVHHVKDLIFGAARSVLREEPGMAGTLGILVDEQYGAGVARSCVRQGIAVAMPAEADGQSVFEFAYGDDYRAHIQNFSPTYVKVLVRLNVEGSRSDNDLQLARLKVLADWLRVTRQQFIFELIVPPTAAQQDELARRSGDFNRDLRPGLIRRGICAVQRAGIEPDVWKVEGVEQIRAAREVAEQARNTAARRHVRCVLLSSGESRGTLTRWLQVAAAVEGYAGFAIGRSIWREPARRYLAGELTAAVASEQIASRYLELVRSYHSGRHRDIDAEHRPE